MMKQSDHGKMLAETARPKMGGDTTISFEAYKARRAAEKKENDDKALEKDDKRERSRKKLDHVSDEADRQTQVISLTSRIKKRTGKSENAKKSWERSRQDGRPVFGAADFLKKARELGFLAKRDVT